MPLPVGTKIPSILTPVETLAPKAVPQAISVSPVQTVSAYVLPPKVAAALAPVTAPVTAGGLPANYSGSMQTATRATPPTAFVPEEEPWEPVDEGGLSTTAWLIIGAGIVGAWMILKK
jgi:hypothetical protein